MTVDDAAGLPAATELSTAASGLVPTAQIKDRPRKKRRTGRTQEYAIARKHPLGLMPEGNAILMADDKVVQSRQRRRNLLGSFGALPDELIVHFLDNFVDAAELRQLGYTSRLWAAFTGLEDFWRQLLTRRAEPLDRWYGSWRRTYWRLEAGQEAVLRCDGLFSDLLHRMFVLSALDVRAYVEGLPGGVAAPGSARGIPRVAAALSPAEFDEKWVARPFVMDGWAWPTSWTIDGLATAFADTEFEQENVQWRMGVYADYMQHNRDVSPLYLFDPRFMEKMDTERLPESTYTPPEAFRQDLFTVLGDRRPNFRWLIVGPTRSGSTFHKDPNATSAWNAVLEGDKYWVMFPPDVPPPGVYVSEDESEVTAPVSIAEWLLDFHAAARDTPGYVEGICRAGEVLHVPSGWWHLVVNLAPTVALTQNFVPVPHARRVLRFLRDRPDQISGFADDDDADCGSSAVYDMFREALRGSAEAALLPDGVLDDVAAPSRWQQLVEAREAAFSFGFASDDE
ncbi:uncharacterized protein V1510DRAFT_419782 [Dipodascopsis tothii]|uniref:uncharacterized protein n=1 Tax=Dipodascopsis tothii TaxID=44089 RepID=UPI0034CD23EA